MSPTTKTLARVPSAAAVWAAILTRAPIARSEKLPDLRYVVRGVRVDRARAVRYARLVAPHRRDPWPDAHVAHPGFVHALAQPLGLALMARPRFPLPALGLVHVKNSLLLHRPVHVGEKLDIEARVGSVSHTPRGHMCEIVAVFSRGEDILATNVSTYVLRGSAAREPRDDEELRSERHPLASHAPRSRWKLPVGIGREFARVSGDAHPIHVSALGARALGASAPLAHGMLLGSRALSEVSPSVGAPLLWEFEVPSLPPLPSTVWVRYEREKQQMAPAAGQSVAFSGFSLRGPTPAERTVRLNFSGRVRTLVST
ncbi:MaoC/PaaZ C-terminal domain-containing protein [Dermabacter sp. Marseille-Q3180]|uniref:MaoC/PaaZ C-terminal domain-containing protein n=1 Tax=Dermabacter sp. Marseille-Q3180 TaxID=2758090 RepID=UPI00202472C0|nr:MaoC/PaaZ C-terminal domain-containing protein [Dermabacter sp. Marseille-Q3180]